MKIIDTHTHLCDTGFDTDREAALQRSREVGVVSILTVSETFDDVQKNLLLARQLPILKPLAGLYPSYLDTEQAHSMISFIRQNREKLVGIGEVGLDFWIVKEEPKRIIQREIFTWFIALSLDLDLPINVHSRSAGKYVIDILLNKGAKRVQLHAFDGRASYTSEAVEAGYYFSIPPSIVRSPQKQKLVKALPLTSMLVETDSPVLGPEPKKRNEPKNIRMTIQSIAEIKDLSPEEVAEMTTQNAIELYGKHIIQEPSS